MPATSPFSLAFADEICKLAAKTKVKPAAAVAIPISPPPVVKQGPPPKPPGLMATGVPSPRTGGPRKPGKKVKWRPRTSTRQEIASRLRSAAARRLGNRLSGRDIQRATTYIASEPE